MKLKTKAEVPAEETASSDAPVRKTAKRVWSIITTVATAVVAVVAVALVGARIFGLTPYAVLTPSMTPTYCVGDLIYAKKADFADVQVGDAIVFATGENTLVTHRVVEIDAEGYRFFTKGDANAVWDTSPVRYENVQGVVVFSLPKLGYVSSYITGPSGRYAAMAVIFALLLLWIVPELVKTEKKGSKRDKAE